MRKVLTTLSALALSAGVANAGSLTAPQEPVVIAPAPVMQGYDWTGGYAGVGLTYGRAAHTTTTLPGFWPNGSGWGIGGLAGYNWQSGNMVYGVEGHVSGHRMRGEADLGPGVGIIQTDLRSLASLRGRIGVAQDRTLVFLTAGPAAGSVRHTAVDLGLQETQTVTGLMIGAGIEQAMAGGWNLRGDLEHYRFRTRDFDTAGPGSFPGVRTTANVARISAVFRF